MGALRMEAIVLAGGRGTRLASVIRDVPKVLAPVGDRPFLESLLHRLAQKGIRRVILSVGYLADTIRDHFGEQFDGLEIAYAVEEEPLGTGGAVMNALTIASADAVLVLNGDTFADLDYTAMHARHIESGAAVSIAVAEVPDCTRFGRVVVERSHVVGFSEKGFAGLGLISVGAYVMNRNIFAPFRMQTAFSLETDFFVPHLQDLHPLAFFTSGYFIDIGVPEDFARAQTELR
jgi:D-glycero-alpha-D-manno-heptose 1-phosphate guanylyltransferase